VPWCGSCDRFLSPSTVRADGPCPRCGRSVDRGRAHAGAADGAEEPLGAAETLPPVPWHLKLLGAALALYLGYRAWQGIEWVWHRL